jgi:hypothetical protein
VGLFFIRSDIFNCGACGDIIEELYAPELLRKEYRCKDDDERDALIESAFDAAQHLLYEYDFSMPNNQDSPSVQSSDVTFYCMLQ